MYEKIVQRARNKTIRKTKRVQLTASWINTVLFKLATF